jgi:hypothetical protein
MADRLNTYFYPLIDSRFRTISPQKQANVYVAAPTQLRAAELLGVSSAEIRQYGGTTGQKSVKGLCEAEPEVLFVERSYGSFSRINEVLDTAKVITLDMKDEDLYGREIENAAFGQISAHRWQGSRNMFMVDYDTGHGITLKIDTASLNRNHGRDRIMPDKTIVEVEMSEVQWATLISSLNSGGTPCTLSFYRDPLTGESMTPRMPDKHAADLDTFRELVEDKARKALEEVSAAKAQLQAILDGGAIRKGDLKEVLDKLNTAERQAVGNLGYAVETAKENIDTAADHAEINAHRDFVLREIGNQALGSFLADKIGLNADPAKIGEQVIGLLSAPVEEVQVKNE